MEKLNIITLGESGVGKTSLLKRFISGGFREYQRSTFVDHFAKTITVENKETDIIVWDTAGQERYNSLIKRYYAMADGVLLVYDVNDVMTFSRLSRWLSELRSENETAEIVLAGNKNEGDTGKLVKDSDITDFARKENLEYMEVSAKTGENVDKVFYCLAKKILIAKGILPRPVPHHSSEDCSTSTGSRESSRKQEDPEISFTYYKSPHVSESKELDETDEVPLIDKVSKTRRRCRC